MSTCLTSMHPDITNFSCHLNQFWPILLAYFVFYCDIQLDCMLVWVWQSLKNVDSSGSSILSTPLFVWGKLASLWKGLNFFFQALVCKIPSKVHKPITTLICNLNMLGPTSRGTHIFQRCAHVSQIKSKWNYNFLNKIVIFVNFWSSLPWITNCL